jgi:dTDP-4-amino-4,6-dideoxygalactose transaminase
VTVSTALASDKETKKNKVWLSPPDVGQKELDYTVAAIKSGWIAPLGEYLDRFESNLCTFLGATDVCALSSGTAAIHLALIIAGVKNGDEVLVASFTFAGSANPIVYLGAKPIFIDSEKYTWNIDPDLLEEAILKKIKAGKKPKALIAVHLYGMPCQILRIKEICRKYEIALIEDAAESLGSYFHFENEAERVEAQKNSLSDKVVFTSPNEVLGEKNKNTIMTGTIGEYGILSFNGNKLITTSGGGALVANDRKITQKARFLSTQAKDPAPHYQHSEIGYNYRLSNICAAIGCGQVESLETKIAARRENFKKYNERLSKINGIKLPYEPRGYFSNRWLTTILFEPSSINSAKKNKELIFREKMRERLLEENIESRPLWKPLHLQPVFNDCEFFGSGFCESLFNQGLCLPSGSSLDASDLERVCEIIAKSIN